CNSRAAANRLIEHGIADSRVAVIGNALPLSAFAEALPAVPRSPAVLRVGMIARMNTSAKNHSAFLRMAARLKGSFPTLEFVLAGGGSWAVELYAQAVLCGL